MLKLLLRYKADVNARDLKGRSPLFHAAKMNNVEAVKLLLISMSNAFAMDFEHTKVEETTEHPEILKMLSRGKSVINH